MKRYFHLLWFELLRLRWPLLWIVGLMLTELGIRAWLVFGPVGKDWPNPPVPLDWLSNLLAWSLVFVTAALFLGHTNAGSRSPLLTQAIPWFLFPAVKLTLLAGLLSITWEMGSMVRWLHDSSSGWESVPLFVITVLPIVAWLAAQAETPSGMAKAIAIWACFISINLIIASSLVGDWVLPDGAAESAAMLVVLPALAVPVIGLHWRRR